jgi:hypothetical protein
VIELAANVGLTPSVAVRRTGNNEYFSSPRLQAEYEFYGCAKVNSGERACNGSPRFPIAQGIRVSVCDDWNAWEQVITINAHEIDGRPGNRNDRAELSLRILTAKIIVDCNLGLTFRPSRRIKKLCVEV